MWRMTSSIEDAYACMRLELWQNQGRFKIFSGPAEFVLSSAAKAVKARHLSQRAERIHALILQLITLASETAPGNFVILSNRFQIRR